MNNKTEEYLQIALAVACVCLAMRLLRESASVDHMHGSPLPTKIISDEELTKYCGDAPTANKFIVATCDSDIACVVNNKANYEKNCGINVLPGGLLDDSLDPESESEIEDVEEVDVQEEE